MQRNDQYTLIEFKDRPEASGPHKWLKGVYINGEPVRVKRGSVKMHADENEPTTVTMTFYPDEVRFNR